MQLKRPGTAGIGFALAASLAAVLLFSGAFTSQATQNPRVSLTDSVILASHPHGHPKGEWAMIYTSRPLAVVLATLAIAASAAFFLPGSSPSSSSFHEQNYVLPQQ